jgi:hypothetical protein
VAGVDDLPWDRRSRPQQPDVRTTTSLGNERLVRSLWLCGLRSCCVAEVAGGPGITGAFAGVCVVAACLPRMESR